MSIGQIADVQPNLSRRRGVLLGQSALCGALSLAAFGVIPGPAVADPTGTKVISGDVSVTRSGTHTEFRQNTPTAILNHNSFDIDANESVHFDQPTIHALAVNRIVGKDLPTTIAGKLTATGNVWVINPSGIAISNGATINVNGLIATTADIADDKILSGDRTFSGAPEGSMIVNEGFITGGTGSVVLVAPKVENRGTILSRGSDVAIGAGSGFTVDMDGDGLTRFEVTPGKDVNIATTGTIRAEGGAVYMSAESQDAVRGAIVSVGGKVEATRVEEKGGVIYIHAGNGKAELSGTVDASQTTGRGGKIVVTGGEVALSKTARLDASGATDGGSIQVGGAARGGKIISPVLLSAESSVPESTAAGTTTAPEDAPLPTARRVTVEEGSIVRANAGENGDGGSIVFWATDSTLFSGHAEARGGSTSGDGGFLEVSAYDQVKLLGTFDLTKTDGANGLVLLDPTDVDIDAALAGQIEAAIVANTDFEIDTSDTNTPGDQGDVTMSAPIAPVSGTGTLTIIADRDVTLSQTITDGGTMSLVVNADRDINVNANIDLSGSVTLTADADDAGGGNAGDLAFGGGTISGDGVDLHSGEALELGTVSSTADLTITTSDDAITQAVATTLTATSGITTINAVTANIDVTNGNDFGATGTTAYISATGGTVAINDANSVNVVGATADSLDITAAAGAAVLAGTVAVDGDINVSATTTVSVGVAGLQTDISTTSGGNITLTPDSDVTGAVTDNIIFVADGADTSVVADGSLVLALNLGSITDTGTGTVTLETDSAFAFDRVTFDSASLDLTANGAVTDTTAVTATNLSISTSGDTVTFDITTNNFGTLSVDTSDGGNDAPVAVSVIDGSGGIVLGGFEASTLDVTSTDGAIADEVGSAINTTAATTLTAFDGLVTHYDILLDNSANADIHNFGGAVTFTGATVSLSDADQLSLTASTATGNVTLRAEDVDLGGVLSVGGGTLTLLNRGGAFGVGDAIGTGLFGTNYNLTNADIQNISATTVRFESDVTGSRFLSDDFDTAGTDLVNNIANLEIDVDGVTLAADDGTDVIRGTLSIESNSIIRQGTVETGTNGTVLVTGLTTIVDAPNDVTLASVTNDFQSTIRVTAADATFTDANSIVLGDIDVTGDLTVTAVAGSITDDGNGGGAGADINVDGIASFSAGTVVVLDDAFNDFNADGIGAADAVNASGSAITLVDVDDIVLGDIDTAGALTVTAGGAVTNDGSGGGAGDDINVTGTTSISTSGAIVLDDAFNDFSTVNAAGADVTLRDANSIVLADIDAGGGLTVVAGGSIADDGLGNLAGLDVNVAGATSLNAATTVTLDDLGTDFGGAVSAAGTNVLLRDLNSIILGDIDASGLTVTAVAGSITDDGVGNAAGADVDVTGNTSLSATAAITLDDLGNDFADTAGAGEVDATGTAITITDIDAINLGTVSGNSLLLTTGGDVTQTGAGQAVTVTGAATINATGGAVTLTEPTNDFTFSGLFGSAASYEIVETGSFGVGTLTATAGDIRLTSDGSILGVSGNVISATGNVRWESTAAGTVGLGGTSQIVADSDGLGGGDSTLVSAGGLVGGNLASSNEGANVIMNGGSVSTGIVTANVGSVSLTASTGSIDLNNTVTAATSITGSAATFIDVHNLSATDLILSTTTGSISQVAGTGAVIGGTSTLTAGGAGSDVLMVEAANNFNTVVATAADVVTLVDQNAIVLGATSATALNVTAGGTITDVVGSSIIVLGPTSLSAQSGGTTFDIVLDNTGAGQHDFDSDITGDALSFVGDNVTLRDVDRLTLGLSTANTSLTATAMDFDITGAVTVGGGTGTAIFRSSRLPLGSASGFATDSDGILFLIQFASGDALRVDSGTAFFIEDATVAAAPLFSNHVSAAVPIAVHGFSSGANIGNVVLQTTTPLADISFGVLNLTNDTSTFSNNLTVISADQIVDTALAGFPNPLIVNGATSLTGTVVTLDQATNDFVGPVAISANTATIADANTITLGDIDMTANLLVTATGSIIDDGVGAAGDDINVDGITNLVAGGTIVLDDTFHDFNNGGVGNDPVNASGTSITLNDANNIVLGDIDASGNMTVVAAGNITDDGDGLAVGDDINVTGSTSLVAGGTITLDDLFNDFVATISAGGTDVLIHDSNAIVLGNVTATSLSVGAGGAVTQSAGTSVVVSGNTSIVATDITLDSATNDFADTSAAGELDVSGASVAISDVDGINLGTVAATSLTLNVGGSVTQTGGGQAVAVTGATTINAAGGVTLTEPSNSLATLAGTAASHDVTELDGLILVDLVATAGDIVVTSGGDALVNGAVGAVATGNIRLESTTAGTVGVISGSQLVANSDSLGGGDATLISAGGLVGGGLTSVIQGNNVIISGGSVTTGFVTATAGSVTATASTGFLSFNSSVTAATSIVGSAATDIIVSNLIAPNLILTTADGDINQFGGSIVNITGNSTLTAGGVGQNIILGSAINDFGTVSATASGDSVTLADTNNIALDQIDTATLTVSAGGIISDTAGADITVSGTTSLVATHIVFDGPGTDFALVNASGVNITLTDANSIALGDIDAAGSLTVVASAGTITDDGTTFATGDIDVAGVTSLSASDGIVLDDLFNDFDSNGPAGVPTDEVDATAPTLVLFDIDDIALGDIDVSGDVIVFANGTIVDDGAVSPGSGVNIDGAATFVAHSVTLDDAVNDFSSVNATTSSLTLTDDNAIVLGDIAVTGNMTVRADGNITDAANNTPGQGIEVSGTTSLAAIDDLDDGDPSNDIPRDIVLTDPFHDFGSDSSVLDRTFLDAMTSVDATGANVTLTDFDAISLGTITANTLTVTSGGSITDTVGASITVTGATSLTAINGGNFFDIALDGDDNVAGDRPHDFNTVAFLGEDVSIFDVNALTVTNGFSIADSSADPTIAGGGTITVDASVLTLESVTASGDIFGTATGRFRIGAIRSTAGSILLTTSSDHFSIVPGISRPVSETGSEIPLWAWNLLVLHAPLGSFIVDGAVSPPIGVQSRDNAIPEDLTFRSDNSLIEFDFHIGFVVVDTEGAADGVYALTFDAPESVIRVDNGLFSIGSEEFLDEVESDFFSPFGTLAQRNDTNLLFVSGDFGLVSDDTFEVRLQNSSDAVGSQVGTGTIVTGLTYLGGTFSGLTLFGTFDGLSGEAAALNGFSGFASEMPIPKSLGRGYPDLTLDEDNTANGCVIGAVTSCTPLSSVLPFLFFDDGRLLTIRFVDPTEDEDDPFSNRGDEEEWE